MAFLLLASSADCGEVIAAHFELCGSYGAVVLNQQLSSRFDTSWITDAGALEVP